jgi:Uma2 family endonuclease
MMGMASVRLCRNIPLTVEVERSMTAMDNLANKTPVEVYLQSNYRPDCDYIDGEVRERNLGERSHSSVQKFFIGFLAAREQEWGIRVLPGQRVRVSESNYRVADVCVVLRSTRFEPIVRTPPLLCVEVVAREDDMSEVQDRVDDYIRMGVRTVWVIDPKYRRSYMADRLGALELAVGMLTVSNTGIQVSTAKIFRELDELEDA